MRVIPDDAAEFQQLLEECTIGTLTLNFLKGLSIKFQQLLEECTIGTRSRATGSDFKVVSVVVRRMYYWDIEPRTERDPRKSFSSCQKNVLLGLYNADAGFPILPFQQLLEECTIGTRHVKQLKCLCHRFSSCQKNVLLGPVALFAECVGVLFQQLLEECTIGTT